MKAIQRPLLRPQVRRGWRGRLLLERAVHPLMPPVLLGMSRRDPLRINPQLDPASMGSPRVGPFTALAVHRAFDPINGFD